MGIARVVAVMLADQDRIISPNTAITSISRSRAINMNRYIKKSEIQEVVQHYDEASDEGDKEEEVE